MKKFVSLALALVMLLASTAALAYQDVTIGGVVIDAPNTPDGVSIAAGRRYVDYDTFFNNEGVFYIPDSADDLFDVPDFQKPISVSTKKTGWDITVTFDVDPDEVFVNWYGKNEVEEELNVMDRVATYTTEGHKYQPGISGAPRDISYENTRDRHLGGTAPDSYRVRMADGSTFVITSMTASNAKFSSYLKTKFAPGSDTYYRVTYADANFNSTNKDVTDAKLARTVLANAGMLARTETSPAQRQPSTSGVKTYQPQPDYVNPVPAGTETKKVSAYYVSQVFDKGQKNGMKDDKGKDMTGVTGWKVVQAYGAWVDHAAYDITAGPFETTHGRDGVWMTETITILDSDAFMSHMEGATAYYIYKNPGNSTGHYLWQVKEIYPEGDIASITAEYDNSAGHKLINYVIDYRSGDDGADLYRIKYDAKNRIIGGWVIKDGNIVYQNGSGKYFNSTWINLENWKMVKEEDLERLADFANPPRVAVWEDGINDFWGDSSSEG